MKKTAIQVTIALLVLFTSVPLSAKAASISASSENMISAGDTAIVNVYLDTEGERLNSVDGAIVFTDSAGGNFQVKDLSVANSAFKMWPRKPSLESGNVISFVGGIPGGIEGDSILLFRAIVKINEEGKFTVQPKNIQAFVNDGLGTVRSISKNTSDISISRARATPRDTWQELVSSDTAAPDPFVIDFVQDEQLYDGKKFVFFNATDDQSGVSYYEVIEGERSPVRTGNTYIIIDQNTRAKITVTAFDKAGNMQVATFVEKDSIKWVSIIVAVLVIIIVYKIIKKIRRRK